MDGTTLLRNPSFLADLRDYYGKRGVHIDDDYDLVSRFHRDQTFMGMNTIGGIGGILSAKSASKENRAQQKRLRQAYQKLPMFFQPGGVGTDRAAGNIAAAVALDPLNLVGFGAGAGAGAGIKAIQGGAAAGKAARAGAKAGAVRGTIAEAAAGAVAGGVMSGVQQGVDLELGIQDNFSVGRLGFDAAAEGVMGGALGGVFGAAGGAFSTLRAHRPTRIAAVKKIKPELDDAAISAMSDDQMAALLRQGGVDAAELDKAGAQTEMAMPTTLGVYGAPSGVVEGEAMPSELPQYGAPGGAGTPPGLAPGTTVGLPPSPAMPTTLDLPDLTILPDEGLASAKADADAKLEKVQADKAADPEYKPDDAEAELSEIQRALDAETQRRAEAAQAQDAESPQAPEGTEAPDATEEAPVAAAPKIRAGKAAQALADANGVDIPTVFAGQRTVNKTQVQEYITQRASDEITSDPIMVSAEGSLSKVVSDVETAGGDVTDRKRIMAELEREIADLQELAGAKRLYDESRAFAQKQARADKKAAGAVAETGPAPTTTRLQKKQIAARKRDILENDPTLTDEQAESAATNSVLGVKEESVPSNYGETKGGSTTARAGRALEEGTEAAGKSIEVRTDVRTGEKFYSTRTAKILRRGFDVGDGRTVINKSDVPTRGNMPREEAVATAETNARNGSGPTVVGFTAKVPTRAHGGKMIERGETGYADGLSGKIFADLSDYEKVTGRAAPDFTASDRMLAEEAFRAQEISAAEAAELVRQHDANQVAGSYNSLHNVPTRKGNLVAAIRFGADGEVRVLGTNQENAEVGLRTMLSKRGGPESNPANWELRYVARPTVNSNKAKVRAFEEADPGETLEQAAISPSADGTQEGGAPRLDDIGEETAPLTPDQKQKLKEVFQLLPGGRTLVQNLELGGLTYGKIWQSIEALQSIGWLRTEEGLDRLIEGLRKAYEVQAQLFPRGVRLPEVERAEALREVEALLGGLDDTERKNITAFFDDMQTGGAPFMEADARSPSYNMRAGEINSTVGMPFRPRSSDAMPFAGDVYGPKPDDGSSIFEAKSPVVMHEMMHWLYRHGMTAKERQFFWESTRKFYTDGTLDMTKLDPFIPATRKNGDVTAGPNNAFDSPQEFFANQGVMFYMQREAQTPEMKSFWHKLAHRAAEFIKLVLGKQVDDDLRPLFSRLLSDKDGERFRLHQTAKPRREEGIRILARFDQQLELEDKLAEAMAAEDDLSIVESARELLVYFNSIGTSAAEAQMIANRQRTKPRTTGVFKVVRPQYNAIKVMRENLYEIITGSAAEQTDDGAYTALGSGFQIEGGTDKAGMIKDLYEAEDGTGLWTLLRKIDDLYSAQYELVEKGQLSRQGRTGRVSLSAEADAEVRKQTKRANAYLERQSDLAARLDEDNVSLSDALLDQETVLDEADLPDGSVVSVGSLSIRDMMKEIHRLRNEPASRHLAHLVGRRLRAGELPLRDPNIDEETALEFRDMTTEQVADAVFDLLEYETSATDFTDDDLVYALAELKSRIDVKEGVVSWEADFPADMKADQSYSNYMSARPTIYQLQRRMDIRGGGAESMRTMFGRLLNMRGKGVSRPGDGNLPMESDAAAIIGGTFSSSDGPLLETSSSFRELRNKLRGVTKGIARGDDSAIADIADMAVRASMSPRERELLAQLGDNVGETVAKRLRGEDTGISALPNRTEVDDVLRKAQGNVSYVINGLIKDDAARKRYYRSSLYGDMDSVLANKPYADVFDAQKALPPSVAPDVAREIVRSGGERLARGVEGYTSGTAGEGQIFYAQTPDGVQNHNGGVFSGGPAGAAIYISTSPQGVGQRHRPGKAVMPAITEELKSRLAFLEARLKKVRGKIDEGGEHLTVHKSERNNLLKNIKSIRNAMAENNTPAPGVTPVIMAGRSIADLTSGTTHNTSEGLPRAIADYLARTSAAQSYRAELINKETVKGSELMQALTRSVGANRLDAMFRAMNYDGVKFRRGPADEIAMYRSEQVSSLTNPALTMPEMALPTDTQPRIYDGTGDTLVVAMEGGAPDPARIEVRNELRVAQGMEPDLSELMADMERSANGEYEPKKIGGMVRTYNRFMRGIADRMDYLGHKQIAARFKSFELDQRRELSSYVAPLMDAVGRLSGEGHILKRTWDYLNEPRRGKGRHRLAHRQSASEDRVLLALRMGADSDAYRALSEDELSVYGEIRSSYSKVHGEMRAQGIPIGDLGDAYFGQVWDQDHIRRNRGQFKRVLVGLYNAERGLEVGTSEQAVASHRMDAEDFAENVVRSIIGDDTNGILPTTDFDGNGAPINSIENSRVLHFQKYPELHKQAIEFMDGSLMGNVVRYMDQATRKINHTRNFGLSGHAVYDYIQVAQNGMDGVAKLLSDEKVFTRTVTSVGEEGAKKAEIRYKVPSPYAKRPEVARQVAGVVTDMVNSGDVAGARAYLMSRAPQSGHSTVDLGFERRVDAIIDGLRDHRGESKGFAEPDFRALEQNMAYTMRRGQGDNKTANAVSRVARRFNNVTLLAFTTLTSLTDLSMPLLRTGDMKAFVRGWKTYLKAVASEDNETKRALRRIGVGMDGVVSSRLTEMSGDGIDVMQDMFFRGTGLTGWTNMNSQISGLIGLESFKAEQAKAVKLRNPSASMAEQSPAFKKAFRYLAHFGLDFRKDTFELDDAAVANAVNQFVSETIFAPNPNQLPSWANNGPWFKTVAQLKSFPMMYERLVSTLLFNKDDGIITGSGLREAIRAGDLKTAAEYFGPAGVMVLAPLFGMGANATKDLVMGRGGEDDDEFFRVASKRFSEDFIVKGILEDQETFDAFMGHYLSGLFTSGGLGLLGQMTYDAGAQLDNDAYGRERIASLMMGPSFSAALDGVKVATGVLSIPDPDGQAKRRTAVRTVTGRIPVAGQMRPFREGVVDAVAGETEEQGKQTASYGVSSYDSSVSGYGKS